jgi:hypothetical protein
MRFLLLDHGDQKGVVQYVSGALKTKQKVNLYSCIKQKYILGMKDKSLFWCVAGEILGFELRASHIFTT